MYQCACRGWMVYGLALHSPVPYFYLGRLVSNQRSKRLWIMFIKTRPSVITALTPSCLFSVEVMAWEDVFSRSPSLATICKCWSKKRLLIPAFERFCDQHSTKCLYQIKHIRPNILYSHFNWGNHFLSPLFFHFLLLLWLHYLSCNYPTGNWIFSSCIQCFTSVTEAANCECVES